jgi:hypothetical protein
MTFCWRVARPIVRWALRLAVDLSEREDPPVIYFSRRQSCSSDRFLLPANTVLFLFVPVLSKFKPEA